MPEKVIRICARPGCGREFESPPWNFARGPQKYCSHTCYCAMPRPRTNVKDLLRTKVARVDGPGCWDWTGCVNSSGYGQFNFTLPDGKRKRLYAHRAAWELVAPPLQEGEWVLHTCDRRLCVRNDEVGVYVLDGVSYPRRGHLFLADSAANARDMVTKGRGVYVPLRGEANGNAKVNLEQVRDIRARHAAGERRAEIAAAHGITKDHVKMIASRRTWKHLD